MVNEPKKNFDTSVTLSGLRLDNPVVPASGTFGYGNEFRDFYDINILGSFSFKGTTRDARFGKARDVWRWFQEAEHGVLEGSDRLEGRLRVDVPSPLARLVLVPALADFYQRHPGIQIDMRVSDRTSDLLNENIDCVIRGGPITDQTLIAKQVGKLRLQTYAAPEYLQRTGTPGHPGELDGPAHRIVGYLWAHKNQPVPYPMRRSEEIVSIRGNYALAVDDGGGRLCAAGQPDAIGRGGAVDHDQVDGAGHGRLGSQSDGQSGQGAAAGTVDPGQQPGGGPGGRLAACAPSAARGAQP